MRERETRSRDGKMTRGERIRVRVRGASTIRHWRLFHRATYVKQPLETKAYKCCPADLVTTNPVSLNHGTID